MPGAQRVGSSDSYKAWRTESGDGRAVLLQLTQLILLTNLLFGQCSLGTAGPSAVSAQDWTQRLVAAMTDGHSITHTRVAGWDLSWTGGQTPTGGLSMWPLGRKASREVSCAQK